MNESLVPYVGLPTPYPTLQNGGMFPAINPTTAMLGTIGDALETLAEKNEDLAYDVMRRAISLRKTEARLDCMKSLCGYNAAMACTWLQNRQPGERNADIHTSASTSELGWFGSGERVNIQTSIRIW